uniref:hypothetical protein n=1 Tax=Paenimyroides ummariense TaxID=913024 RepID=UPI0037C7D1B6
MLLGCQFHIFYRQTIAENRKIHIIINQIIGGVVFVFYNFRKLIFNNHIYCNIYYNCQQ